MKTRAHVIINGRVQGVFFRQRTKQEADFQDVKGWVRNLPDGSVEAVFEGEQEAVNSLVESCKQGPPSAKVASVNVNWESYRGDFSNFKVK